MVSFWVSVERRAIQRGHICTSRFVTRQANRLTRMAGRGAALTHGCPINSRNRYGSLFPHWLIMVRKFIHLGINFPFRPCLPQASLWMMVQLTLSRPLLNAGVMSRLGVRRVASCVFRKRASHHPPAPRNGISRRVPTLAIIPCMFVSRPSMLPPRGPSIPFTTQAKQIRLSSIRRFSRTFTMSPMAGSILANIVSMAKEANTSN